MRPSADDYVDQDVSVGLAEDQIKMRMLPALERLGSEGFELISVVPAGVLLIMFFIKRVN